MDRSLPIIMPCLKSSEILSEVDDIDIIENVKSYDLIRSFGRKYSEENYPKAKTT